MIIFWQAVWLKKHFTLSKYFYRPAWSSGIAVKYVCQWKKWVVVFLKTWKHPPTTHEQAAPKHWVLMEMYSALQHWLWPLSTPMFLTVCYSFYKAPRRPENPLLAFPLNPLTLPCTDPHSSLLLAMHHNVLCEGNWESFCFYCQKQSVLTRLKDKKGQKTQTPTSFSPFHGY